MRLILVTLPPTISWYSVCWLFCLFYSVGFLPSLRWHCWLGGQICHVLTRDHTALPATQTFIHKWKEPYLPSVPSCRASPHFGWYSFPVPLRIGGWFGPVDWWNTEVVCPLKVIHPNICHGGWDLDLWSSIRKSIALTPRLLRHRPSRNDGSNAHACVY